jgi:hypothetical protein
MTNTIKGNKTMTRTQLISAFLTNATVKHLGQRFTIESIEREDGSGFCFIVTLQGENNERKDVFIRTLDHPSIGHPQHTLHAALRERTLRDVTPKSSDADGRNVPFPV